MNFLPEVILYGRQPTNLAVDEFGFVCSRAAEKIAQIAYNDSFKYQIHRPLSIATKRSICDLARKRRSHAVLYIGIGQHLGSHNYKLAEDVVRIGVTANSTSLLSNYIATQLEALDFKIKFYIRDNKEESACVQAGTEFVTLSMGAFTDKETFNERIIKRSNLWCVGVANGLDRYFEQIHF